MRFNRGSNPQQVKLYNRAMVMNHVLRDDKISRSELASSIGLTKGGLSPIVGDLVDLGLLVETTPEYRGRGRTPIALSINGASCRIISVAWTRRDVAVALVTPAGSRIEVTRFPVGSGDSPDGILERIGDEVSSLVTTTFDTSVVGVGVVAPGPIDATNGVILRPPNFHDWEHVPVVEKLGAMVNLPVFLDNNANAHGIAEQLFGVGRDFDSFLTLVIDEGIGSAITIDGHIYRGSRGFGGEFGHVTIEAGGPTCACGNTGCLELYASIPNLLDQLETTLAPGAGTNTIVGSGSGGAVEWRDVLDGLKSRDSACARLLELEAQFVGSALVGYINLFGPQAIVLSSQIAEAGAFIVDPLKAYIRGKLMAGELNTPAIVASSLTDASLLGGAAMVFARFIDGELGEYESVLAGGRRES